MKYNISEDTNKFLILSKSDHYSFQNHERFLNYFFPTDQVFFQENQDYTDKNEYTINLFNIQETFIPKSLDSKSINCMLCLENASFSGFNWYKHYNMFGDYGDKNVNIYLYNHKDKLEITNNYICIPVIYCKINYFNIYNNVIKPTNDIPFENRKFCIVLSCNNHNAHIKNKIRNILGKIEKFDQVIDFKKDLRYTSCYHSNEFISFINQYKFAFVCENSDGSGYITEKIFNCFFAKTVPIYYGSHSEKYFNKDCYIDARMEDMVIYNNIEQINKNKSKFEEVISSKKIVDTYDDENYKQKWKEFIMKF